MNLSERTKEQIMSLVSSSQDQRVRPFELERTLTKKFGIPLFSVKEALKDLIEEEKLVYTYQDPCSYVEISVAKNHRAARPMKVVKDADGEPWICDSDVDPSVDLEKQGCWRCRDIPFTRND